MCPCCNVGLLLTPNSQAVTVFTEAGTPVNTLPVLAFALALIIVTTSSTGVPPSQPFLHLCDCYTLALSWYSTAYCLVDVIEIAPIWAFHDEIATGWFASWLELQPA